MDQHLKLIAILPPEPVFSEVRKEQEFIATTWGPEHALRTPPHITIIPPISVESNDIGLLYGMADMIAYSESPFKMQLRDYGSFKPKVIFINPIISNELNELYELWHQALLAKMPRVLDKYPERTYHPHITLAHKDVTREQYDKIWKYYTRKEYRVAFPVNNFCILEYKTKEWVIEKQYSFRDLTTNA